MSSAPHIVKISSAFPFRRPTFDLLAQMAPAAPGDREVRFVWNEPVGACAAWIVLDGPDGSESALCPPENVILLTAEPAAYKAYDAAWLRSFARVITTQRRIAHPGTVAGYTPLPWFVRRSFEQLVNDPAPAKTRPLSIICSNRHNMRGHRRRLRALRQLKRRFGSRIDWFGRKINPIDDKWDGLAPYRFSIAIENCEIPDYWSEKIADCFLTRTVPVYGGAPDIESYFPAGSLLRLDLDQPDAFHALIERILADSENLYARMIADVETARRRYLEDYCLGARIRAQLRTLDLDRAPRRVALAPEPALPLLKRKLTDFKRAFLGTT